MKYYRISDAQIVQMPQGDFAKLSPEKRSVHRIYVVDEKPVPTDLQYVAEGPIAVGETEAHKTWVLVDKSPEQLAAEAEEAATKVEYQQIKAAIQALKDGTGTQAERIKRIETALVRLLRDKLRDRGE